MAAKKNAAAQDLRTPKYRPRIVKNLKKTYTRRPKHPARAADSFSAPPVMVQAAAEAETASIRHDISGSCSRLRGARSWDTCNTAR